MGNRIYKFISTYLKIIYNFFMAEFPNHSFTLMKSQRGGDKLVEGGYTYGKQRRLGEVIHWLCEQRGSSKAILHTKGGEIIKRTNIHLHPPDEQAISCSKVKLDLKRKANHSQDSSHQILGESLQNDIWSL